MELYKEMLEKDDSINNLAKPTLEAALKRVQIDYAPNDEIFYYQDEQSGKYVVGTLDGKCLGEITLDEFFVNGKTARTFNASFEPEPTNDSRMSREIISEMKKNKEGHDIPKDVKENFEKASKENGFDWGSEKRKYKDAQQALKNERQLRKANVAEAKEALKEAEKEYNDAIRKSLKYGMDDKTKENLNKLHNIVIQKSDDLFKKKELLNETKFSFHIFGEHSKDAQELSENEDKIFNRGLASCKSFFEKTSKDIKEACEVSKLRKSTAWLLLDEKAEGNLRDTLGELYAGEKNREKQIQKKIDKATAKFDKRQERSTTIHNLKDVLFNKSQDIREIKADPSQYTDAQKAWMKKLNDKMADCKNAQKQYCNDFDNSVKRSVEKFEEMEKRLNKHSSKSAKTTANKAHEAAGKAKKANIDDYVR